MVYSLNGEQFTRRKKITINNNSGGALTAYQTYFTVTYTVAMQTDFDDLRFAYPNGTNIHYWIDSKTDGISAIVWIKVDLQTGDNIIYMYYGNPSLTSASSGANVFELFDDFEDGVQTSWTDNGGTWSESSGQRHQTGTSGSTTKYSYKTLTGLSTYIVGVKLRSPTSWGSSGRVGVLLDRDSSSDAISSVTMSGATESTTKIAINNESIGFGTGVLHGLTLATGIFYHIEGARLLNEQKGRLWAIGSSIPAWQSSGTFTSSANTLVGLWAGYNTAHDFDDFYVRQYVATEPTVTIGNEEHQRRINKIF